MRAIATVGLVSIAAAVAAGCGGSSMTQASYVAKADALCKAAPTPKGQVHDQQSAISINEQAAKEREQLASKLKALSPPSSLQSAANRYNAALEEAAATNRQLAALAKKNQPNAYQTLSIKDHVVAYDRYVAAQQVGFHVCGTPSPPPVDPALEKSADGICADADNAILSSNPPSTLNFPALVSSYAKSYPVGQASVAKLKALQPSPQAKQAYDQFVAAYTARMAITGKQFAAAKASDKAALTQLSNQDANLNKQEAQAAGKLGFGVCGQTSTNGV